MLVTRGYGENTAMWLGVPLPWPPLITKVPSNT